MLVVCGKPKKRKIGQLPYTRGIKFIIASFTKRLKLRVRPTYINDVERVLFYVFVLILALLLVIMRLNKSDHHESRYNKNRLFETLSYVPSGVLGFWPGGLELTPGFYPGSSEQHRLFQASTENVLFFARY